MPQPGPFFCLQDPFALGILLQRGIADFLSAMPSPFLGVSSLNLAASAPRKRPFFFSAPPAVDARATAFESAAVSARAQPVKYGIDYQFLPKGATKPEEIGTTVDVEITEQGFGLIPAVGDYVDVPSERMGDRATFRGRVRRRLFRYLLGYCHVSILIEEADEVEWAKV
jgi:hypothetical protein